MTKTAVEGNTLVLPLEPFLIRINRHLVKLIPSRELFYNAADRQYYVRVINLNQHDHLTTQGPYYYHSMVGLARHINALTNTERQLFPIGTIKLKSRKGAVYDEARLSGHLKFDVLTPVLRDTLAALQAQGYTVTPPATATVTHEPDREIDPDTGEAR